MRIKALLVAAATALALAACHAADATGPATARTPPAPSAEGGTGMFGSGGYAPNDTTPPKP